MLSLFSLAEQLSHEGDRGLRQVNESALDGRIYVDTILHDNTGFGELDSLDNLELSLNTFQSYTVLSCPSVHLTLRPCQTTHMAHLAQAQCKAAADGIKSCMYCRHCEGSRP